MWDITRYYLLAMITELKSKISYFSVRWSSYDKFAIKSKAKDRVRSK